MPLYSWREDLRKPLSIGIGVIGLVFAVVTWIVSHQVAALSVKIVQIPVFDWKQAISVNTRPDGGSIRIPVTVLDGSGKAIDTNIYAAEVAVWNSGDLELGEAKIRRPLVIAVGGGAKTKILDAGISRATEPVDDISALVDSSQTVTVKWHYLDPGDGFRIRVLYTSDKQEALALSTTILGIHRLYDVDTFLKGWTLAVLFVPVMASLVLVPLSMPRILGALEQHLVRHQVQRFKTSLLLYATAAGILVVIGIFLYWVFLEFPNAPQPPI